METPPERPDPGLGEESQEEPGGGVSLRRIEGLNLVLVGTGAALGFWISPRFGLGVLVGGLVMAANFRIIYAVIRSVFLKGSTSPVNVAVYWAKFAGLMLLVGILILKFKVDAVGFLVGLSGILMAITLEAVLRLMGR